MPKTKMTECKPKKEMTVGELKKELKEVFRKLDKLESLEKDKELGELFISLPGQLDFTDLIAMLAVAKVLSVFGEYLGLPKEAISLPKKEVGV